MDLVSDSIQGLIRNVYQEGRSEASGNSRKNIRILSRTNINSAAKESNKKQTK